VLARAAPVLAAMLAMAPTIARSDCTTGDDTKYVVWTSGDAATVLGDPALVARVLRDIRNEVARELPRDVLPELVADTCSDTQYFPTPHDQSAKSMQKFLDKVVVFGLAASPRQQLEYYVVPYRVERSSGLTLESEACELDKSTEGVTKEGPSGKEVQKDVSKKVPRKRQYHDAIHAYAYAALALYEMRLLDSQREPCSARRAEAFVERALSYLDVLLVQVRNTPSEAATVDLRAHLAAKCGSLNKKIAAMNNPASKCAVPYQSDELLRALPPERAGGCVLP
jgi:hypothetical protein